MPAERKMFMKTVSKCDYCPNLFNGMATGAGCTEATNPEGSGLRKVENFDTIPEWCPLPDADE